MGHNGIAAIEGKKQETTEYTITVTSSKRMNRQATYIIICKVANNNKKPSEY